MKICLLGFNAAKFWTGSSQLKVQVNLYNKLQSNGIHTDLYIFNSSHRITSKIFSKLKFVNNEYGKTISGGVVNFAVFLVKEEYSIIHFILDRYYQFILIPILLFKKVKIVTTYHDNIVFPSIPKITLRNIINYILRYSQFLISDFVFIYNEYDKREILKKYKKANLIIVKNGVEDYFFELEPRINFPKRVLYASGFKYTHKGYDFLKEVYLNLNNEIEVITCGYDGEGRFGTYKGHLDYEELKVEMKNTSALILPSQYESFSILAIEAMATGLPVIMSNTVGMSNYLKEKEDGVLFFDFNDTIVLKEKIEFIFKSNMILYELSKNATRAAKQFSWDIVIMEYIELYKMIYGKK